MFYSRIACLVLIFGLGACASSPKYVAADNPRDYGHYTTRLEENRYRIAYNGGRTAGPHTTRDYALLRAAELTLQEGYDWFRIVDRETETVRRDGHDAGFAFERTYYVERRCGLVSCTQSVRPWTYSRVNFDTAPDETRYSHVLEIVMGKGELPSEDGDYYDAQSVAKSLWESM